MRTLGVPYEVGFEKTANTDLVKQADIIAADLQKQGIDVTSDKEIIALIAYIQRLGTDIKNIDPKTQITK
jgi:cytochrome c oxidase cbb3-type subunit I/II